MHTDQFNYELRNKILLLLGHLTSSSLNIQPLFSRGNRKDIQSDDNQENIDQDLEPNATSSDSVTNSEVFSLTREQKEELLDDLDKYGNRFNISLCSKVRCTRYLLKKFHPFKKAVN